MNICPSKHRCDKVSRHKSLHRLVEIGAIGKPVALQIDRIEAPARGYDEDVVPVASYVTVNRRSRALSDNVPVDHFLRAASDSAAVG